MLTPRPASARGHVDLGWLDTRHTFSFGDYYDPEQLGFRALRVINEDRVAPGAGFPTHSHRDMEILTLVLHGAIAHRDSTGHQGIIEPGEIQRMTAGSGIAHSELNASETEPVHFLQIWIEPATRGLPPSYEQSRTEAFQPSGGWRSMASPDGGEGAVTIHQDARLFGARLLRGERLGYELDIDRHAWLHVVRGAVELGGVRLDGGSGAAVSRQPDIDLVATDDADLLLFDLA